MAVHIAVQKDFSRLKGALHHLFSVEVNGIVALRPRSPLSVQIGAHQRAPVIAHNYAIRILHGHDFEDKQVSKFHCDFVIRQ